jgi:uncharacterized repeat protein (TIGR01451 family)
MKYSVLTVSIATIAFLALPALSYAAQTPNCIPIYGGGDSCTQTDPISVNLQVQHPDTEEYVDNLNNEIPFSPGQEVSFKITVANTGTRVISNLAVSDVLPQYIDYVRGEGKFDRNTRTFSFTINELGAEENRVYFVEGKVVGQNNLPKNAQNTCVVNQVSVSSGDRVSRDNARLCIENPTAQVTTTPTPAKPTPTRAAATKGGTTIYPPSNTKRTPDTGPEALALIGLAPLGALGFYLKKRA